MPTFRPSHAFHVANRLVLSSSSCAGPPTMAWWHVWETGDYQSSCLETRKTQRRKRRRAIYVYMYIYIYIHTYIYIHHISVDFITGDLIVSHFISWCLVFISLICVSMFAVSHDSLSSPLPVEHLFGVLLILLGKLRVQHSAARVDDMLATKNHKVSFNFCNSTMVESQNNRGDERLTIKILWKLFFHILSMFGIKTRIADCPLIAPSKTFLLPTASTPKVADTVNDWNLGPHMICIKATSNLGKPPTCTTL